MWTKSELTVECKNLNDVFAKQAAIILLETFGCWKY